MQPMGSHAAHVFLTPILNPISRLNSRLRSHFAVLSSAGRRIWTLGFGVEFRQDASKLRNRIQLGVNKRFQSPTVFPNHTQQFPVRSWSLRTRVPPNNGEEKKKWIEEEEDSNPRSGSCGIEGKACWFRAEPVRDAVDKKKIRPLGQNRKTKGNAWAWPVQEPYKIPAQATGTDA